MEFYYEALCKSFLVSCAVNPGLTSAVPAAQHSGVPLPWLPERQKDKSSIKFTPFSPFSPAHLRCISPLPSWSSGSAAQWGTAVAVAATHDCT